VINRYVGNLPPMPGVFPDYPAPVIRYTDAGTEMVMMRWGMPPPPRTGGPPVTNIRNTSSPHWRGSLKPCLGRCNSSGLRWPFANSGYGERVRSMARFGYHCAFAGRENYDAFSATNTLVISCRRDLS
jgi:hypothetical protein